MTEAMAEKLIDAYVAEGNSTIDLGNLIVDAVMEALGFNSDDVIESNEENDLEESEEGK